MRQDQFRVTVSYRNARGEWIQTGVWDKFSGGEADSEETKYKPGGMGQERSLGGSQTVSNVTVTRLYDIVERDDHTLARTLRAGRGKYLMSVSKQPLDADGNAFGRPDVYTGMLKRVKTPDHDSETSSAGTWELEISSVGSIG